MSERTEDRIEPATSSRPRLPSTVSSGWRERMAAFPDPSTLPERPAPDDAEAWARAFEEHEAAARAEVDAVLARHSPTLTEGEVAGVPVLEVRPARWSDDGRVIVYAHGGSYTSESAWSSLPCSALVAAGGGIRVVSVDYTLAPRRRWDVVTDQVARVISAVIDERRSPSGVAVMGDSAGGGLAAGSVLRLRDELGRMPAALVLWSPWADITETGDTYATLRNAELEYTYARHLGHSARAYADGDDQRHPYVSPVYGDFGPGFPPTLIQGGTRELLLSCFVRLYQAIATAGQSATLDIYEGMIHVFQSELPDSTESQVALGRVAAFLDRHLGARVR